MGRIHFALIVILAGVGPAHAKWVSIEAKGDWGAEISGARPDLSPSTMSATSTGAAMWPFAGMTGTRAGLSRIARDTGRGAPTSTSPWQRRRTGRRLPAIFMSARL